MDQESQILAEISKIQEALGKESDEHLRETYLPRSFHWDFITSEKKTRLFVGSNQSGKTFSVAHIALDTCMGFRPWIRNFYDHVKLNKPKFPSPGFWFKNPEEILKHEKMKKAPPVKVAVVAIDFESAVTGKILELIPGERKNGKYIKSIDKSQGRIVKKINFQNGSSITFFSKHQDDFHFEGETWDLIIFDEPPKQNHYVAMKRGSIVKSADLIFSMTPLSEPWIFDTLKTDAETEGTNVMMATCDLFSEEIDWMTIEDKEDFKKEVYRENPHNVEARVHGKFAHMMGRIFPTYDADVHFITPEKAAPVQAVTYGMTVDPHDRKPFMIAWWYVDTNGNVTFFKEWPNTPFHEMKSSDLTVPNYADMIKEVESHFLGEVMYRYIDPNSGPKRNVLTGQSVMDEFANHNLFFDNRVNDSLEFGHNVVRDYLYHDKEQPVSNTNCPKMFISQDCYNLNFAMQRYVWDDKRVRNGLSEKPQEIYKDPIDVIRYTLVKHPVYVDYNGQQIWTPDRVGRVHGSE